MFYNSLFLLTRLFRFFYFSYYSKPRYTYLMDCANSSGDELSIPLIMPDEVEPDIIKPKSILSWNIRGLSLYIDADIRERIMNVILGFGTDILCLQECFDDDLREILCNRLLQTYPFYVSGNLSKRFVVGEDSGLMIFSKYPITNYKFFKYTDSFGADYMSNKGVIYVKIGDVNIATTHIQSEGCCGVCTFRDKIVILSQINELIDNNPFDNKMIVCGDLNKTEAEFYFNSDKNNTQPTHESLLEPIDYIISMNNSYDIMAAPIELKNNPSDHKPLYGIIRRK